MRVNQEDVDLALLEGTSEPMTVEAAAVGGGPVAALCCENVGAVLWLSRCETCDDGTLAADIAIYDKLTAPSERPEAAGATGTGLRAWFPKRTKTVSSGSRHHFRWPGASPHAALRPIGSSPTGGGSACRPRQRATRLKPVALTARRLAPSRPMP